MITVTLLAVATLFILALSAFFARGVPVAASPLMKVHLFKIGNLGQRCRGQHSKCGGARVANTLMRSNHASVSGFSLAAGGVAA
jgi:hypothetical protein